MILVKFVQQRHQALLGEDEKGKNDDRQQFDVNNYDDINDIVSDRVNDDDVSLGWQTAGVSDIVSDDDIIDVINKILRPNWTRAYKHLASTEPWLAPSFLVGNYLIQAIYWLIQNNCIIEKRGNTRQGTYSDHKLGSTTTCQV